MRDPAEALVIADLEDGRLVQRVRRRSEGPPLDGTGPAIEG